MENKHVQESEQLPAAVFHLRSAIGVLDAVRAPAHIAAHVDLALHQVEELMKVYGVELIETNAETQ